MLAAVPSAISFGCSSAYCAACASRLGSRGWLAATSCFSSSKLRGAGRTPSIVAIVSRPSSSPTGFVVDETNIPYLARAQHAAREPAGDSGMKTIGVGLIGTGFMGKCHALAWNAVRPVFGDCAAIRLAKLADVDARLAAEKADAFGFQASTTNWRDLLDDPQIDVVSVTAPNAFHPEMAIEALKAGKQVWCEKPMAPRFEDALRMRQVARESGHVAALGYNYIQNPMVRQIGRLLSENAIGEVNHVRIEMDEDFMADPAALFYWKSEASSGYGALDDFAVHPLSLIWTLLGRIRSVMADMAMPYAERPLAGGGTRAVETCDIASVLFRLESGASGILAANRSAWGR